MQRNLALYPVYQALRSGLFWLPVFFLYFLSVLSLEEALLLESIYYLAVVVLEVPSGHFSDRVGRRRTLLVSSVCAVAAPGIFAATSSFAWFALAQLLLAAAYAFNSGTDSALLYDSLRALGREDEVGAHESRAISSGLGAAAVAAAAGGLAGGLDLRWAYLLSALSAAGALAVVLRMSEPPHALNEASVWRATRQVAARLRDPALAWVFAVVVGMVVLSHVPYEFFQPYLAALFAPGRSPGAGATPAVSGAVVAVTMGIGALAGRSAMRVRDRLGPAGALLVAMGLTLVIIGGMAVTLAAWVVPLLLLRSAPMGLVTPIARAEIHPRVPSEIRATFLSVQSLAGRLAFSLCLAVASGAVAGEAAEHGAMVPVLWTFGAGGLALLAVLVARSRVLQSSPHRMP